MQYVPMTKKSKSMLLHMPEEMREQLHTCALALDISDSAFVRLALEKLIDGHVAAARELLELRLKKIEYELDKGAPLE
jgi:hypothetical protein